jgi:hypothetical protein
VGRQKPCELPWLSPSFCPCLACGLLLRPRLMADTLFLVRQNFFRTRESMAACLPQPGSPSALRLEGESWWHRYSPPQNSPARSTLKKDYHKRTHKPCFCFEECPSFLSLSSLRRKGVFSLNHDELLKPPVELSLSLIRRKLFLFIWFSRWCKFRPSSGNSNKLILNS